MSIELISAFIGLILTLMVFSYLIGDNPLFRIAIYLFIGVSSGYAAAVVVRSVLLPKINVLQSNDINQIVLATSLCLSVTLLAKFSTPTLVAWKFCHGDTGRCGCGGRQEYA